MASLSIVSNRSYRLESCWIQIKLSKTVSASLSNSLSRNIVYLPRKSIYLNCSLHLYMIKNAEAPVPFPLQAHKPRQSCWAAHTHIPVSVLRWKRLKIRPKLILDKWLNSHNQAIHSTKNETKYLFHLQQHPVDHHIISADKEKLRPYDGVVGSVERKRLSLPCSHLSQINKVRPE